MKVREHALALLDSYELGDKYINLSLNSHSVSSLDVKDKGFLTALVYTAVEHKITLDYYASALAKKSIDSFDIHTLNIIRLGFTQILYFDSIPQFAAVNETVALGRHKGERGFVNGLMRALCTLKEKQELPMPPREKNPERYLGIAYSFPLKLVKLFSSLFGIDETEKLLAAFNSQNYTDITVNTSLISRDDLVKKMNECGISARESERSPISVRLLGSYNPERLPGFSEGHFFVQDEICAVSVGALGINPTERILDVCACPGGKSFAAAILTGKEGRVYASDLHGSKLSLITSGASRLCLDNIEVTAKDARFCSEEQKLSFDKVICDVPCSGLGVLGKKPDIRYKNLDTISSLPQLQLEILSSAAECLKPGGVIVYSTCTLNPEENERVVERFLSTHTGYRLSPFSAADIDARSGMFTAYPHVHGTDGFFIAKITKG